jgi:hypothetical protein
MAGNTVIGALRVNLGIDSAAFSTGLGKVQKDVARAGKNMSQSLEAVSASLARTTSMIGNFSRGLAAGFVAGGITGLVSGFGDVARGIAAIGDEARRAGLGVKAFQELKFVAEQNRVGVDSLVDGMKELSLRADEFIVNGGGPAAEAFKRLGYDAQTLRDKLRDPSALFTEIIGKLQQLDKAAQIRVADEVFGGTGGEKFVQLIQQGEQGIRDQIQAANNLGIVLDEEVINRAAEVDRQFNIVAQTVGTQLKSAIVSAAASLQDFIAAFYGFEGQRTAALDERLASLGRERLDIERQILELREKQRKGESVGDGILGTGVGESTFGEALAVHERRMEALRAEEERILAVVAARQKAAAVPPPPESDEWTPPAYTPPATGGRGSSRAVLPATTDQWTGLRKAAVDYEKVQEEINERTERFGEIAVDAFSGLARALEDGKLEGRELFSILADVARQLLSIPSIGGGLGGFGSILAGLFKGLPGFKDGGRFDVGAASSIAVYRSARPTT